MATRTRSPRASAASRTTTAAQPSGDSSTSPLLANPLARQLAGLTEDDRKKALAVQHPDYVERADSFRLLLDAYEGTGGFLDGGYLVKYPNELNDEYVARKDLARYHNYYRALVNIYVRHIFREGVTRESTDAGLMAWWRNVDGAGTAIDAFMTQGAKLALAAGHAGALVDKEPVVASGPSRADDRGRVIASWFTATAIRDWQERGGELLGVKLCEAKPRTSILDPVADAEQTLIWAVVVDEATGTRQGAWVRVDADGEILDASGLDGVQPLDFLPFTVVRPDPSAEHPFLGYALGGDGRVFKALLNRCSEEDQVLRDQAFSVLTVNVPEAASVAEVSKEIGNSIGTTRALVTKGEAKYITPDMAAPEEIRKNIEFLIREIYRMAHVRYEKDSLAAESADAIRLNFTELNEMLANLALVLEAAERQMARAYIAWTHPGDQAAIDAAYADAAINISYSHEFFVADLLEELQKWANALKMDLGLTFEHWIKKRVVDELAPSLDETTKQAVYAEIAGQASQRAQSIADAQARLQGSMTRIAGAGAGSPGQAGQQPPAAPPAQKAPIAEKAA